VAGARFELPSDSEGKQRNSADVLAERKPFFMGVSGGLR
jgi:hypothetical protein